MKLSLLFVSVGFILVLLQTTLPRILPLGPFVPDLALVLCVYLGLNHPTVGAVVGIFMLGYSVDVFSSRVLGVNSLAMSLVFLTVYLSSRFVWVHNPLLSAPVVFVASWVKLASLMIVWTLFLTVEGFGAGALKYALFDAMLAAILAPVLFALLKRGQTHFEQAKMPEVGL
jgi:rod shape-determining protein MreD